MILFKVYVNTYSLCSLLKLAAHSDGNVPVSCIPCKFLLRRITQYIMIPDGRIHDSNLCYLKDSSNLSYNIYHLMSNNDLYLAQPVWYLVNIMFSPEWKNWRTKSGTSPWHQEVFEEFKDYQKHIMRNNVKTFILSKLQVHNTKKMFCTHVSCLHVFLILAHKYFI